MTDKLRIPYYKTRGPNGEFSYEQLQRDWWEIERWANSLSTGGPGGWDAICDVSLSASVPEERLFKGIGEALAYLRNTVGLTQRAFVLVRTHPTSSSSAVNRYVETADITTAPANVYLFSANQQQPLDGGAAMWDHNGFQVSSGGRWFLYGIEIHANNSGSLVSAKTAYFTTGDIYMENCNLNLNQSTVGLTSGRFRVTASGEAIINRCSMQNGWVAFTEAYDCEMRIFTSGTYNPGLASGAGARFLMIDCALEPNTLFDAAVTWTLAASKTHIRLRPTTANTGDSVTFDLTATNGRYYLEADHDAGSFIAITSTAGIGSAELRGMWGSVTLVAPATSHVHTVRARVTTFDITGPALIDVRASGQTTIRGNNVNGSLITTRAGQSSGAAVNFVAADRCQIHATHTTSANSGTFKPYTFDASSDWNILVWNIQTGDYPAAATDAGTNNIVLPGAGAGSGFAPHSADYLVGTANSSLSAEIVVGTTPGGELGGSWASPTVDATHSGSSHAGVITTHEAAGDPHTGYQLESEKNAANGYPGLNAGGGITGIGNDAAATTPGSVVKKVEIFDEAGVSLGFLAVYDAIT